MPSAEVFARIYSPEYVSTHYAAELEGGSSSAELAEESARAVALICERTPRARLLDVGCGAGAFLVAAHSAGLTVEGHELMPESAAIAAQRTGRPVHSGPLTALNRQYDVIHLADVLEHSPTPLEILREAILRLAPNGLLLLRGPLENQANVFHGLMRTRRSLRAKISALPPIDSAPYHVILFTLAGWHALLSRAQLATTTESVYETHWPAPERPTLSLVSVVKELSLRVSTTGLGQHFGFGNRVMSLVAPRTST